jgi:uncharacterized cofD-like protein
MTDKKFVVIGGGTGTFSVLSGLKNYTENITAIVTMADSGGSARKERDEWGLLPSSDIRKSLIALSDMSNKDSLLLRELFQYRYNQGRGMKGMTFGNIFLVTLTKILGSQTEAIKKAAEILRIKGKVLPVSLDKVDLVAVYEDNSQVVGEHYIDDPKHNGKLNIISLFTKPPAYATDEVMDEIITSDVIIIGPGSFYTTILANLVVKGVKEAILKSKARKIFILNLMTEYGQTYNYSGSRFVSELDKYLPVDCLDSLLINNRKIPSSVLDKYRKYHANPVINDFVGKQKFKVVSADLLSDQIVKKEKGDKIKRSFIRHDPDKIVRLCMKLLNLI